MQEIGKEKWIEFRGKAYKKCMDFILKWQEKLKEMTTSPLTIKIYNELETLKVIIIIIYGYMVNLTHELIILLRVL